MMKFNYHTHTFLCNHAGGEIEEYVKQGIKMGLKTLGFADHVPVPFSCEHRSHFRMRTSQISQYVDELVRLREKYSSDIRILIGYEMEYYPREYDATLDFINQYPCDYLILGQHFINNEYDGVYMGSGTVNEENLKIYVDQSIEGLKTGKFLYFAHPDLPIYTGDMDYYRQQMIRLCRFCSENNIPLELNFLGLATGRHYPRDEFWKLVREAGNRIILGCDAHSPNDVANPEQFAMAMKYLERFGLTDRVITDELI